MKKLAIMGSGTGSNFEAITRFFDGKNVEITCICNKKDAPMLEKAKKLGVKSVYLPFEDNIAYFAQNKFDLIALAGYMKILPEKVLNEMGQVINIHPSILPAFKGSTNAIKEAFLTGVKVSGITIHEVTSDVDGGKIIAQYPVLIENLMHYDEFEAEIHKTEHKLYPVVIEKILEDKVFDFSDLLKSSCSGGGCSSGCGGGCNH